MDRQSLETEIGYLLGDPQHSRWSVTKLRERIEYAQQQVQALTNAIKQVNTYTPVADTKEVTVGSDIVDITRATFTDSSGEIRPLTGKSRIDWDFYHPNWENEDSGLPTEFSYDASNRQVILRPKPSSDHANADALKLWEVNIPTVLSGSTSEPFEANQAMQNYAMSIVHWVVAQCFQDDGTPEALSKSRFHRSNNVDDPGEFEKWIKLINSKFNAVTEIPARVKWYPQGGRVGGIGRPSKTNPLG